MQIFHQSVFEKWPLDSKSVQAIITSPPYWGLRHYDIPDITIGAWRGQYGLEPTVQDYVAHTLLWAKEAWRVLRDDGVFFLNIGDSFSDVSGGMAQGRWGINSKGEGGILKQPKLKDFPKKCKLLIPHRVAIALIDSDKWTLRNDLVWFKPNAMPESVTDRFSKKFEYIFMFTKSPKYYFDLNVVRETYAETSFARAQRGVAGNNKWVKGAQGQTAHGLSQPRLNVKHGGEGKILNSFGKNPGDVWSIPTQPSSEKHFAMWPEKLVERMVKCATRPGDMVCDPFCGSGTTLKVAEELNRKGVGIDLGYKEVQGRRLSQIQKRLLD